MLCNLDSRSHAPMRLRWDKGDTATYYSNTGVCMYSLLQKLDDILQMLNTCDKAEFGYEFCLDIDNMCEEIIHILSSCAETSIPRSHKNF